MAVNPTPAPAPTSGGLHITWSWSMLAALCVALAGIAGTVITPIYGSSLSNVIQAILQGLSGILLLVGGGGGTTAAVLTHRSNLRLHELSASSAVRLHEYRVAKDYDDELDARRQARSQLTPVVSATPPPHVTPPSTELGH